MSHGTLLILELRQSNADLKSANKVLVLIHEMVLAYCFSFLRQSAVLNEYHATMIQFIVAIGLYTIQHQGDRSSYRRMLIDGVPRTHVRGYLTSHRELY